jgi:hypothetical protein
MAFRPCDHCQFSNPEFDETCVHCGKPTRRSVKAPARSGGAPRDSWGFAAVLFVVGVMVLGWYFQRSDLPGAAPSAPPAASVPPAVSAPSDAPATSVPSPPAPSDAPAASVPSPPAASANPRARSGPAPAPSSDLRARLRLTATQLHVTNLDTHDWTDCTIELNNSYTQRIARIEAGGTVEGGLMAFTNRRAERFNPRTHAVQNASVRCSVPGRRLATYHGYFQ